MLNLRNDMNVYEKIQAFEEAILKDTFKKVKTTKIIRISDYLLLGVLYQF